MWRQFLGFRFTRAAHIAIEGRFCFSTHYCQSTIFFSPIYWSLYSLKNHQIDVWRGVLSRRRLLKKKEEKKKIRPTSHISNVRHNWCKHVWRLNNIFELSLFGYSSIRLKLRYYSSVENWGEFWHVYDVFSITLISDARGVYYFFSIYRLCNVFEMTLYCFKYSHTLVFGKNMCLQNH